MKRLPDVTDEEIKSYMDFDKVLLKRNSIVKFNNFFKAGLVVSGVAVISAFLYVYNSLEKPSTPVVVSSAPAKTKTEAPMPQQVLQDEKKSDVDSEIPKELPVKKQLTESESNSKERNPETSQVAESQYIQAEPVSGYDVLFAYFRSNLSYPKEALADSIQGVLTVSFVINKEGKPQSIEFQKSLGAPFEQEALKLIQQMPPWKPASLNGKPVNSKISLPLTFELKKK